MDKMLKLTIPAALISASFITVTGCQQKEVLADRPYIAAPVSDVSVPPAPPVTMMPNSNVIAPAQNPEEEIIVEETSFVNSDSQENNAENNTTAEPAPAVKKTPKYPQFVGAKTSPVVSTYNPPPKSSSNAVAGNDVYVVQKNDTLSQIAQRHGVKTADLAAVNGISTNSIIRVGQKLKMPAGSKKVQQTKSSSNKKSSAGIAKAAYPADGVYTVKSGDSLWLIARRFDTTVAKICAANNISADTRLQIGQKIKLPGANNSTAASSTTAKPAAPAAASSTAASSTTPTATTTANSNNTATAATPAVTVTETVTDTITSQNGAATVQSETVTAQETTGNTADIPATTPAEITTQTAVIHQDIMLESYCKIYRWNLDEVLKLNPNLTKESVLKAGETIVLPSSTN